MALRGLLELISALVSLALVAAALGLLVVLPRAVHRRSGSAAWTVAAVVAAIALVVVGALALVLVALEIGGGS